MSPEATGLTVMCRDRRRTTRPEETSIRTGATVPTTPSVILIPICCSGVAKNNPKYSKMTFLGLGLFVDVIKCGITTHDNYVGSGWSRDQDVGLRLWHWPTCTRRQWQRLAAAARRFSQREHPNQPGHTTGALISSHGCQFLTASWWVAIEHWQLPTNTIRISLTHHQLASWNKPIPDENLREKCVYLINSFMDALGYRLQRIKRCTFSFLLLKI